MAENIVPRYSGSEINIEPRNEGAVTVLPYRIVLTANPPRFPVGGVTEMLFYVTLNDVPFANDLTIVVRNTNPLLGNTPVSIVAQGGTGIARFSIIGLTEGVTTISGEATISGLSYTSNPVTIGTNEAEINENYGATGYGQVTFSLEPNIAVSLTPRIERLSHEEQKAKYPGDDSLKWASYFGAVDVVFIHKDVERIP